tara:strand:- start:244 stop:1611 length:1368 start_codon:yes stop_codon:yes gene_type:complete
MKYLSTRNSAIRESFSNVLFQGLSKEGGLFLPESWPNIDIKNLKGKSYNDVAFNVINPFLDDDISREDIFKIIFNTYDNFNHPNIAPLVEISEKKYILELFYGPTFAFKDYALQLLGNLFYYFIEKLNKEITVLGATSGDTGSAAINAFKDKNNINIFILHPHNKISEVQRKQMTTVLNKNVFNIAIEGNFDDCQKIVKDLFVDKEMQKKTSLTAINSINWARLIAQTVYYFWAYLQSEEERISFIVPSGNFGNIFSARVAKHMGLPIDKLHIATNLNDSLHRSISEGKMNVNHVVETFSPSMDIQISSNFERQIFESLNGKSEEVIKVMTDLQKHNNYQFNLNTIKKFQKIYNSTSVSNEDTLKTISFFKKKYNYLADPHTATGLYVLERLETDVPLISLACAHPAKFGLAIKQAIGSEPSSPSSLKNIFDKEEKMTILPNTTDTIKNFILENI